MSVIPVINPTDSMDQWRQKTNNAINELNNESINEIVTIVPPQNDQDILVYQASGPNAGFFINVGIAAFITATINELNSLPTNYVLPYYLSQTARQVF
jgi:hypothetical protein